MLVKGLPSDSAYGRAIRGEHAGWGYAEELLAGTVERLDRVAWLVQAAWFKGTPAEPRPVWRPGDAPAAERAALPPPEEERPRKSTPEEIRAFFFGAGAKVIYSPD